jgi:dephospho-CoA kinase
VLTIGLTGGIGAGKSAVAGRLVGLGAVLVDADVLAREVVAPGTEGLREIVAAFGDGVLRPDGALDRPALGERVFGDDAARRTLEGIIHPRVRARTAELIAAAPADAIVVNDVPLLVETGLAPTYPLVIVVTAAEATRVARLERTRGMSETEAYARIRAQAPEARRRAAADVLLTNDGALADLGAAVAALWRDRLVPFEANLRAGRAAPANPAIVAPDPDWPVQAQRLAARLAAVAGPRAVRIDHLGATAVPALPARDVLELQVVVPDGELVSRVAADCRAAGLVPVTERRPDLGRDGAEHVRERVVAADPGRAAEVHIRPVTSPVWRDALLCRDWLRADPAARAAHAANQTAADQLAGGELAAEWSAAERWAADTGWSPPPADR